MRYAQVRSLQVPASGVVTTTVKPMGGTRMYAQQLGCAAGDSTVLRVQSVVSLTARQAKGRSWSFTGSVSPVRTGQRVQVLLLGGAKTVVAGTAVVDGRGRWTLGRTFTGAGSFTAVAGTATSLLNDAAKSPARPVRIR